MIVSAANFHPMRGHVAEGVQVAFRNGANVWVRPTSIGWALFDESGARVTSPGLDAMQLTLAIVEMDAK